MRHGVSCRKFSRPTAHRVSMLANMAVSLVRHERIVTTVAKAKDLRPFVERLVTIARRLAEKDPVRGRRLLLSRLGGNLEAVNKMLGVLAKRYARRPGGYTRILKDGFRSGDCAPVAIMEFVDRKEEEPKKAVEG
ncbi:50S ribosomal protein L17 [Anaplasma centrale str. Israel]|uniref:Large ribosomal subunit protein bL17 n=1 Tax=Anaplasma centrale (strain Israel) TaxID=574556 RepID=D1AU53_ANACI|nr:50S ribosomal protein L17 [Anaplasma centrale]ACZ49081.1 50S ribosomal protein L17 [Anaplasma centrale str. Israel]